MEVAPDKLIEIFKAGFRVGEAKRFKTQDSDVVASNDEIESDAYFIVMNILGIRFMAYNPRKGGRFEQIKKMWHRIGSHMISMEKSTNLTAIDVLENIIKQDRVRNPELYKGVF